MIEVILNLGSPKSSGHGSWLGKAMVTWVTFGIVGKYGETTGKWE